MSIDPKTEAVFPLSQANRYWPGKNVGANAWYRRALRGIRVNGRVVKLATILLGRERVTSQSALDQFLRDMNSDISAPSPERNDRGPQADSARRELAEMGV